MIIPDKTRISIGLARLISFGTMACRHLRVSWHPHLSEVAEKGNLVKVMLLSQPISTYLYEGLELERVMGALHAY